MSKIRFFYSLLRVHWGFSVRLKGATASQPSLPLPPPTTILGAFAQPLLKLLDIGFDHPIKYDKKDWGSVVTSSFKCFLYSALGAAMALDPENIVGVSNYAEITRIMSLPYRTGGKVKDAIKSPIHESISFIMPVQAMGSSYSPGALIHIGAVLDIDRLSECLNVAVKDIEDVGLQSCYGVSTLGSKEGLVSVVKAYYGEPMTYNDEINTIAYVPEGGVIALFPERFMKISLWDLDYKTKSFLIPVKLYISANLIAPPLHDDVKTLKILPGFKAYAAPINEYFKVVGFEHKI
jgi:CRISPR-associated protein Cas5a/b/c